MRVSFIYLTNNPNGDEHLGTASIAAYLEKYNVETKLKIISFSTNNCEIDDVLEQIPTDVDLIGFPLFFSNAQLIYEIAQEIKRRFPRVLISVGGPLATDAREIIFDSCSSIDFLVLGDGEEPYLEVVKTLEKGEKINSIKSIVTKDDENIDEKVINITDVTRLPWVSRQYLEQMIERGYGTARIYTARGCCANCSFCSHNNFTKSNGRRWRGRDIVDVFQEIVHIHKKYGIVSYTFNDGSFEDPGIAGKERIKTFCNLVLEYPHRLHFWCFLRADTFKKEDISLIKLMRKAGFTEVFIGIESQNVADLNFYNKLASKEENIRSLELFKKCDINVLFGFIMFNPVSTLKSLLENYFFLRDVKNWRPHAYVGNLAIYYNTDAHRICEKLGLLKEDFSYLYPYSYRFVDSEVETIWEFIEKRINQSVVIKQYDFDLFYFNNYFHDFMALFPEETSRYKKEYQQIMDEVADVLATYFYYIYVNFDILCAEQEFPIFEQRMKERMLKMNALKLKMLLKEPFKSYISQFSNKTRNWKGLVE